jgi:hypothetical protein
MFPNNTDLDASAIWRESEAICALADRERHLGHILKIGGRWHAFDATHLNQDGNGFRFLGSFANVDSAKQAIEDRGPACKTLFAGAA